MARNPLIWLVHIFIWGFVVATLVFAVTEITGLTSYRKEVLEYAVEHNLYYGMLLIYCLIMALPFVPGVTLGLAIIMMFGPGAAPMVWAASVVGFMLAFAVGYLAPDKHVVPLLMKAGLGDKSGLFERDLELTEDERLSQLFGNRPFVNRIIRHRYLASAALILMPGNVVLGGAGGLSLVAGLTKAFNPVRYGVAVGLAIAPVPFLVYFFGLEYLPEGWLI